MAEPGASGLVIPGLPVALERQGPLSGHPPELEGRRLVLTAAARTDLFVDPSGAAARPDAERFVGPVHGDFLFSARVLVEFKSTFDAGVLLARAGEDRWCKLCAERDGEGVARVVSVVTRDRSDDANAWPIGPEGVSLRIARIGAAFAFHARSDGGRWELVRHFTLEVPSGQPVEIGLLAQSPRGEGTTATFADISFSTRSLLDVRDGS